VALCDQDDIWHTDHLINSIIRLNKSEDPALSFSAVSEFNTQNPAKLKVWPNQFLTDNIISTATENYARGCTMVMNRQAVKYFQSNIPTNAIMHDWWILIVIRGVGKIFWTPRPEIDYRIHQMNFVGPTPTTKQLIFRMWKFIIDPKLKIIQQAREVLELYKPLMTSHEAWKLEVWLLHASSPLNRKRARAVLWPERLKSNWSREIAFRIQLAVGYVDKH
jgi:hypothetical protein